MKVRVKDIKNPKYWKKITEEEFPRGKIFTVCGFLDRRHNHSVELEGCPLSFAEDGEVVKWGNEDVKDDS